MSVHLFKSLMRKCYYERFVQCFKKCFSVKSEYLLFRLFGRLAEIIACVRVLVEMFVLAKICRYLWRYEKEKLNKVKKQKKKKTIAK